MLPRNAKVKSTATVKTKQILCALAALPLTSFASSLYAGNLGQARFHPNHYWGQQPQFSSTGAPLAPACPSGLVWRGAANAGDGVCVTPQERTDAQLQNANGANNMAGGGAYGPNTCRQGYVWREAFAGDTVCVTPYERTQAQQENSGRP